MYILGVRSFAACRQLVLAVAGLDIPMSLEHAVAGNYAEVSHHEHDVSEPHTAQDPQQQQSATGKLAKSLGSLAPLSVPVSGLYRSQAEAVVMLAYHEKPVVPNLCGGQMRQEEANAIGSCVYPTLAP